MMKASAAKTPEELISRILERVERRKNATTTYALLYAKEVPIVIAALEAFVCNQKADADEKVT